MTRFGPGVRDRLAALPALAGRRLRPGPAAAGTPAPSMPRRTPGPPGGSKPPNACSAARRAAALGLAGSGPAGLVRGDPHPGNVLVGGERLGAADPRPCVATRPSTPSTETAARAGDP
ncbi:hypothetical protein [Planomonospora alba]|uniref:hypothetical protein n=1 Tax=Planomonospora alba TaxID=161354 RepID=UPI0031EFE07B